MGGCETGSESRVMNTTYRVDSDFFGSKTAI